MPEFPLSRPDLKQTEEPREHRGRSGQDFEGARHWRLVQVSRYANLQPSQIVREMDAPDRGWAPSPATGDEHTPRAERQDATADADRQRENTSLVTVDERRYVVDPIVDGHTFTGLWTGGPIQHYVAKDNHKYLRQTLTRTWCAGHGYTVAEDGAYIAEWPASFDETTGEPATWTEETPEGYGGVHGTSGNKDKEHSDAPPVREYRTAKDCLKACRPWMEGRLSPYMVFRTDIPSSYTREVYWREFTHESITPLERLGKDVAGLREVVAYHFGSEVAGNVLDAHTRVDPQTNTVIFVCSLLYTELAEPETPDELLELPVIDAPCTRDTLRMFGWGQLRDGEGYEYTHVFRWPRLKDSETTRRTIEFVKDNAGSLDSSFLPNLLAKHYHPEIAEGGTKPDGWWAGYETVKPIHLDGSATGESAEKDNTGRLVTQVDTGTYNKTVEQNGVTSQVPAVTSTPSVQHYRIAQQKVDVEQDGSLTFTIAISKAEWHGYDDGEDYESGGRRQLASVSAPQGYGVTEHRVIPSIPRENAIPTMNAIEAKDAYELVTEKRQTEGQKGSSDVSFQRRKLYDYLGNKDGHTPDFINIDSNPFNSTTYRYDPNTNTYTLDWTYVNPKMTQELVDKARSELGGTPVVTVQHHPEGYDSVHIVGKGRGAQHIEEWCVEADWFKHETLEQWLGVDLVRDADGKPVSFKYRPRIYKTDSSGNTIVDWEKTNDPTINPFREVLFSAIRGDLDANWMGSDPQKTQDESDDPTVYMTTGMEPSKVPLNPAPYHSDVHGNGWGDSKWTDPDDNATIPPGSSENDRADGLDKQRSHCMTKIGRQVNEDGTYNITVRRIYPHQRYWTWQTEAENADGDTRTVFHFAYRNWASRKAIQTDIIEKIKEKIGEDEDWSDGWTLNGGVTVNEFGLVDAPGLTLAPSWGNRSSRWVARAKTSTYHCMIRRAEIEKTYTAPDGFDTKTNRPKEGYWWRPVWTYIYQGQTTSVSEAYSQTRRFGAQLKGSKAPWLSGRTGINGYWNWYVVYAQERGEWSEDAVEEPEGDSRCGEGGADESDQYDIGSEAMKESLYNKARSDKDYYESQEHDQQSGAYTGMSPETFNSIISKYEEAHP